MHLSTDKKLTVKKANEILSSLQEMNVGGSKLNGHSISLRRSGFISQLGQKSSLNHAITRYNMNKRT